jgi:molecular chaperone DnaK (HSP70)
VSAKELRTDIEQAIDVKPSYGLTDAEVERMLIESFEHAEADFEARLLIEARNEAETVVLATEKSLRVRISRSWRAARSRPPKSPPSKRRSPRRRRPLRAPTGS